MHHLDQSPDVHVEVISRTGDRFTLVDPAMWESQHTMENPVQTTTVSFKGTHVGAVLGSSKYTGKPFYEVIQPFDNVHVTAISEDGIRYTDVYGVAGRLTTVRGANGEELTSIPVYSLGEPLVNTLVFWHSAISGRANLANIPWLRRAKEPIPGTPPEVLKQIFQAWFNDSSGIVLADGRRLDQAIRLAFHHFDDALAVTPLNAMNMEGSVWEAMKAYANTPFAEFFTAPLEDAKFLKDFGLAQTFTPAEKKFIRDFDLGRDYPTANVLPQMAVYLRPTPFIPTRWDALARSPGWNFSYDDNERLGSESITWWDTSDISSFFWCFGNHFQGRTDQLLKIFNDSGEKIPIVDNELLRRYGFRKLEKGTRYVEPLKQAEVDGKLSDEQKRNAKNKANVWEQLALRNAELATIFGYEKMAGGQVSLRGRIGLHSQHGIRVGSVITRNYDGGKFQFYCDSYSQSWQIGSAWTTTVNLTRGVEPEKWRKWYADRLGDIGISFLKTDLNAAFSPFGVTFND